MRDSWNSVLKALESRPSYPTPGALAKAFNPATVQTPALDLIDKELVKLAKGRDGRLILSMPPQEGKSERCAFWFPVWLLMQNPYLRIGIVSYSHDIARRWGRKIRDAISEYDLGIEVRDDVSAQNEWQLTNGVGGVFATGVDGGVTGRPVDVLIIDDPIKNRTEADSKTTRKTVWEFWTSSAMTRLAPGAPVLLDMTRWHEDDLAGRLLAEEDSPWRSINIPAQAKPDDILGRAEGDWLTSTRGRSVKDWEKRKRATPSRDWEALYQGSPSDEEGALFPRALWQLWEGMPPVDASTRYVQSWDMAFKGSDSSDYTVGQFWIKTGANCYLIDQVRGQWTFTEAQNQVRAFSQKWPVASEKLVEDKANGTAIIDSLRQEVPGLTPVQPLGGKYARASAISPFVASGNIFLPKAATWRRDFIDEAAAFPTGAHDDQVDAASQAIARLLLPTSGLGGRLFNIG